MLNNPKRVPSPGSAALNEALNLISGLGSGDKNLKKMLEEMKEVQKHNEEIAQDAVDAVSEAIKTQDLLRKDSLALEKDREAFESETRDARQKNADADYAFEKSKTDFSDRKRKLDDEFNERHGRLVQGEMDLAREIEGLKNELRMVDTKKAELGEREDRVSKMEGNLYAIQEYLKSHL